MVLIQAQPRKSSGEGWPGQGGLQSVTLVPKCSCILCWTPREKSSVEEEIKEKEEAVRQHSSEVQVRSRCSSESALSVNSFCGEKSRQRVRTLDSSPFIPYSVLQKINTICFRWFRGALRVSERVCVDLTSSSLRA